MTVYEMYEMNKMIRTLTDTKVYIHDTDRHTNDGCTWCDSIKGIQ